MKYVLGGYDCPTIVYLIPSSRVCNHEVNQHDTRTSITQTPFGVTCLLLESIQSKKNCSSYSSKRAAVLGQTFVPTHFEAQAVQCKLSRHEIYQFSVLFNLMGPHILFLIKMIWMKEYQRYILSGSSYLPISHCAKREKIIFFPSRLSRMQFCILLRTNLLLQRALAPLIIPSLIFPFHLIRSFLHSPSPFLTCPETPSTPPPLPLCRVHRFRCPVVSLK